MKVTIDIEPGDIGIVRVALVRAIEQAESNRRALKDEAPVVERIDHRIAVLSAAKEQISDQECAEWLITNGFGT